VRDSETNQSLACKVIEGSFLSFGSSAITAILGFCRYVILARLLFPVDFGVVALAMFFLAIARQARSFGFSQALIHRNKDIDTAASTFFVLTAALTLFSLLLIFAGLPVLKRFYPSQPQMINALIALCVVDVLGAMNATPLVLLRKEMMFRQLAIIDVACSAAMTIVAPAMALAGYGFWSLVAEQAVGELVRAVGVWTLWRPWRFSIKYDREIARWYFRFGSFVFVTSGLALLLERLDDFWAGTALGPAALGFYSRAYEFARYPRRVFASPIERVFFPAYAKLQHDREQLSKAYERAGGLIVRTGFLFSLVFALIVPEFIRLVIGAKWLPMVLTFRLMIFYALLDPLFITSSDLITAVGQPRIMVKTRTFQLLVFVPALVTLSHRFGIEGVAVAVDLMMILGVILVLGQVGRFVDFSVYRMFFPPTVGLLSGGGIALAVRHSLPLDHDLSSLLLKGIVAAGVYCLTLLTFEHKEYGGSLQILRDVVKSYRRS
jgi:O-antigen/teichoic acid export membrane protein